MDKVCFIILNYNNYQDTIDCVRSLQSSIENEKFDIIVVDNNSSNDSIEKLILFIQLVLFQIQKLVFYNKMVLIGNQPTMEIKFLIIS